MEGTISEIRMFGANFAPRSWALCEGQLLPISQNQALFSLLGTTYGGDGRTTYALPDLRGRLPMGAGNGAGLSNRPLGQKSGQESVTLTPNQLPSHNHVLNCESAAGTLASPAGAYPAASPAGGIPPTIDGSIYSSSKNSNIQGDAIRDQGGSRDHTNEQPFLVMNFIISLFGVFPSRN